MDEQALRKILKARPGQAFVTATSIVTMDGDENVIVILAPLGVDLSKLSDQALNEIIVNSLSKENIIDPNSN